MIFHTDLLRRLQALFVRLALQILHVFHIFVQYRVLPAQEPYPM